MTPTQLESLRQIQSIAHAMMHSGVILEVQHGKMIMELLKKIKEEE